MSNTWGKGSVNNNIGWGQAAGSATNNWGESQKTSWAGQTDIVGITSVSIAYSSSAFCADASDPTPTISNNAGVGTFSSTAGLVFISTTTGEVDIDASTVGSYLITYTDTDSATATFNLTINALPTVIVSTSDGTICVGESTILTASGASTYVWNDGVTLNPRTVSPTTTTLFTATGTDSNGCTSSGGTTITVNPQDSAAFSYAASSYCANGTDPTPTITGTSGGAFTSTAGLVINSGTGEIDLDASTVGTYSITYTTTGVCPANQSVNLTINAADNAAFSYSASSYTTADADPTPTITGLTGGTFSGTTGLVINSTTGEIDLSASTVASHTVTYNTSSSGSSVCPNTSTFSLAVTSAADADATAFISRVTTAGGSLSTTEEQAINTLVTDLKSANIWTKMKAIYPMVGASAAACAQNLKSSSFTGTFSVGGSFTSNGYSTNNVSYMDTNLLTSTALTLNSSHLSFYSRTLSNGTEVEIGNESAGNGSLIEIRTSGTTYYRINSGGTYISSIDSDSRAFYISNRTASNVINGWRNSTKVATGTVSSSALTPYNIFLGAWNQSGTPGFYTTKECAFASIGDGLTDTEASDFYTAVQAFNTTLSRQV